MMWRTMKKWRVVLLALTVLVGVTGGGAWLCHRWMFPYGWSHSCDKHLWSSLRDYAEDHDGAFPAGEATPEASLSLLYPRYANEYVLQGKTVPLALVKATLERGDRLGPDTCGWHYVEGLTVKDDHRLALCWDKVGLGHNGQRLPGGGHMVIFIVGIEQIPEEKWQEFLEEQERLLAERNRNKRLQ